MAGELADFDSISVVARSIEMMLNAAFEEVRPVPHKTTHAVLARTADLDTTVQGSIIESPALSLLIYRVDVNKTMRAAWSAVSTQDGRARLPLDLHILLTPWAENADHEARILGCAMQCLDAQPILSGPLLHPAGAWAVGDALQIGIEDISTENLMRIFDSLPTDYKLSVAYVARILRLDERRAVADRPVATFMTRAK